MKRFLIALLLTISFCSCTSPDVVEPTPPQDHHGYSPVSDGSSWEYKLIIDGDTTALSRKIDGDTLLNGKRYSKYMQITETKTSVRRLYRRSNDTLYSLWGKSGQPITFVEWPHLIEKLGVAWATPNSEGEPSQTDTLRVVAKGISRTVQGKTYNDVLHMEVSSTTSGSIRIKETSYYAKGIGLIENNVSGESMVLVDYSIK
ncbi:MAG: hypothetical protein V4642_09580 [Bacteroidota bacterium]